MPTTNFPFRARRGDPENGYMVVQQMVEWLRDAFDKYVANPYPAWASFSPTVVQGATPSISSPASRYVKMGKTVIVVISFSIGVTPGTAGSDIVIGNLPTAASSAIVGNALWAHWGGAAYTYYSCAVESISSTSVNLKSNAATAALGNNPSFAANQFDYVRAALQYESLA